MAPRHVVFVGPMGSGKSTVGSRVAVLLDRPFLDNDELLEAAAGMSAADLEQRDGIEAVHRREAAVLLDAISRPAASVIAAAASTVDVAEVREALRRRAWVVWLRADHRTLTTRMPRSTTRPLSSRDPSELVAEQARHRDPLFAEIADAAFDTGRSDAETVAEKVVAASGEGRLS